MNKAVIIFFVLILFSLSVYAQPLSEIQDIQNDLRAYSGITLSESDLDKIIVVEGNDLNLLEKSALKIIYQQYPVLKDARQISDDIQWLEELAQTDKIIIFIGGPSQNTLAKEYFNTTNDSILKEYDFVTGLYSDQAIILSDKRGFANLDRGALAFSPLSDIIPEKYIPLGAAIISVLFLLLFEFLTSYFEGLVENFRRRKKQIKEKFIGFRIKRIPIRFRELFAIIISALVFALAVTWTFTANSGAFVKILGISAIVCISIFVFQEITRMILVRKTGTLTEFVLNPLGIIVTLGSAFLGNVFGHPGRWLFKHEEYAGRVYYTMLVSVFLLSILFFIINVVKPSIAMQLAMTVTSTVSLFEFLPFKPLSGKEIFNWRPRKWLITFIFLLPVYVLINFFL